MKQTKKAFTLIELLVVISIIGLLASVVLASLNSARIKAADSSIQQNLATVRAQAALYIDNTGSYDDLFYQSGYPLNPSPTDPRTALNNALNEAITVSQSELLIPYIANSGSGYYVVMVPLRGDVVQAWCVDSTGASMRVDFSDSDIDGSETSCI